MTRQTSNSTLKQKQFLQTVNSLSKVGTSNIPCQTLRNERSKKRQQEHGKAIDAQIKYRKKKAENDCKKATKAEKTNIANYASLLNHIERINDARKQQYARYLKAKV